MKALKIFILALNLFLLFSVHARAQSDTSRFRFGQFGFEAALPVRPSRIAEHSFSLIGYSVHGVILSWDDDPKLFVSLSIVRPFKGEPVLTVTEKANIIAAYKKSLIGEMQGRDLMTNEVPYTFGGSKGVEIRGAGFRRIVTRLFFLKNQLVAFTALTGDYPGFDEGLKLLDSFRILTKEETIEALKSENAPAELPPVPAGSQRSTDAQYLQLKGAVRAIVEERQEKSALVRELVREAYFDPAGNLTREVSYNIGYPQEITHWGWVDGKRVSSSRVIFYEPEGGPQMTAFRGLGPTTGMMGEAGKDQLYGSRYEFRFDDKNRVTEQKSFGADGSLAWTKKFTYPPAGRDIQTLDNTGQFLTRFLEVQDKDGNITEIKVVDASGRAYSSVFYTYEYDATGNWITRRSQLSGSGPVKSSKRKPDAVHFRKITYYEKVKTP